MPYPGALLYPGSTTFPGETSLTAAFQGYFNGLQFGPGSDVQLVGIQGLRGMPALRSGDIPIPLRDGSYPGVDLLDERIFTLDLLVTVTADPFENVLQNVGTAFQTIMDPRKQLPFQFLLPGWTSPKQIICRPTKGGLPIDGDFVFHKVPVAVEMTASDPLVYDTVLQAASTGLPSPAGGLTFPAVFPAVFGTSSGGSMQLVNSGNYATEPVFTIQGPALNPYMMLLETGQFMRLNMSLTASDSLVVDMHARTVMLNGTAARFNAVATGSSWFGLPPGTSTIQVGSADGAQVTASFSVAFRSAWGWI